jgi:hypothetical protein
LEMRHVTSIVFLHSAKTYRRDNTKNMAELCNQRGR